MRKTIGPIGGRLAGLLVATVVVAAAVASCTSEKLVYKSQPNFTTPPTAAGNFVGYTDTATKQTACGNCHVDKQAEWAETKHSNAWADLQASGHATASCEPCHSVDSYGNATQDTLVGFLATRDARYQDVQCENCHGPGLAHVTAPTLSNRPLASIAVDTGLDNGCGECHTGSHNPFVDEWVQSAHAREFDASSHGSHAIGNASCSHCHVGQDALVAWGVNTNYVEANEDVTNAMTVTCAVCHDPHGGPNEFQLRYPIDVRDTSGMLCMKCHQRNGKPEAPADPHPPMSPEGPVLLGFAGWFPPSYTGPDTIVGTHGSAANADLCVTCHMGKLAVSDSSGTLIDNFQGHTFVAAPCLNSQGEPTTGECDISQRSFAACTASGCHGSPDAARSAMTAVISRLALLDSALSSQIVQIPDSLFQDSTHVNTAIGAKFNLELAEKVGSAVHNPFLMETLLTTSIQQVQMDYGIAPTISVNLTPMLQKNASKYR